MDSEISVTKERIFLLVEAAKFIEEYEKFENKYPNELPLKQNSSEGNSDEEVGYLELHEMKDKEFALKHLIEIGHGFNDNLKFLTKHYNQITTLHLTQLIEIGNHLMTISKCLMYIKEEEKRIRLDETRNVIPFKLKIKKNGNKDLIKYNNIFSKEAN